MEGLAFIPAYLEKGGLTITSFVFVSVPLGPYSVGLLCLGSSKLLPSVLRAL